MEEQKKVFQKGDYVRYANNGVCQIVDYSTLPSMGEGMFYVLKPNANPNSIIFVPAFNEKLVGRMQHILSRAEIDALILDAAQGADALWSSDRKERMERFHGILRDCEPGALIRLVRCLYEKKQELLALGKKLSSSDEFAMKQAEGLIENEFAFSLGLSGAEVQDYIRTRLGLAQ